MRAGGMPAKRGALASATMRARSASLRACAGLGRTGLGPTVRLHLAVLGAPALEGPQVDAGQAAGRSEPGTGGAGLADLGRQGLAVFRAGHASSPSRKTAPSFFESTSKAVVSANALSLPVQ